MIFHPRFSKDWNYYEVKLHVKSASFSTDNGQTSRFSFFYRISNDENFIPKYLRNAVTDSVLTSRTSTQLLEENAPVNDFGAVTSEKWVVTRMDTPKSGIRSETGTE